MTIEAAVDPENDRITHPSASRTPYGPDAGSESADWPVRVDQHLAPGVSEADVDSWVDGEVVRIAVCSVRVGLCGWTTSMPSYVQHFPLVEVQHTFYEPPSDTLLRRWRASVPPQFEFTIKAWQLVTHEATSPTYRRLKHPISPEVRPQVGAFRVTEPVMQAWERTLACARILRASAVLLQCPKSFRPTVDNVTRLRTFMSTVDRPDARMLWEPRGDWPDSLLDELCRDLDLVHVVDPMQRETVTPEQTYYRLHGTTGSRHVHTDDELLRLRALVDGRPSPYVLFNNLPRVGDAKRFLALL